MNNGRFLQIGIIPENMEKTKSLLEKIKPISIIIMRKDFTDLQNLKDLIKWLKNLYRKDLKLEEPLIAVDQEGGNVVRIRDINYPPSNYALGILNREKFSYYYGAISGYELRNLGFDWDLAPVLDVLSNKDNYIVMERSFGELIDIVSMNGVSFIRGLQDYGIIATAKHFPGHGSVQDDSHEKLPVDSRPINSIRNTLKPFEQAINNGVRSVMISHVLYSSIDPDYPASISPKIYDILRNDLGFAGVTITDSLDMKAISKNYSIKEFTKKALESNADILECVDPYLADEIHDYLDKYELKDDHKAERILELKIIRKKGVIPPPEISGWLSSQSPRWLRRLNLNPESNIELWQIDSKADGKDAGMIIKDCLNRLKGLKLNIKYIGSEETPIEKQVIIVGKNLHLRNSYERINELCRDRKCVYVSMGVPVDSGLIPENIGYITSAGLKYETLLASIYSVLGFYDVPDLGRL